MIKVFEPLINPQSAPIPNPILNKTRSPRFLWLTAFGAQGDNSFIANRPESSLLMANGKSGVQIPAAR